MLNKVSSMTHGWEDDVVRQASLCGDNTSTMDKLNRYVSREIRWIDAMGLTSWNKSLWPFAVRFVR